METFRLKTFDERIKTMGDIAEQKFEEHAAVQFVRYGLNRPKINMAHLPPEIRHTPDYLTTQGLVEVQGLGKDQILKVKHEKLEALQWWSKVHPLYLFIYDSYRERTYMMPFKELNKKCIMSETNYFPEGKPYYAMPSSLIWADNERK
jgi:hypothetical protein